MNIYFQLQLIVFTNITMKKISKKDKQHNGQKKKGQKDKQRSTKHTHETKDRVTTNLTENRGEPRCPGRVNSSCSNSDTSRVTL